MERERGRGVEGGEKLRKRRGPCMFFEGMLMKNQFIVFSFFPFGHGNYRFFFFVHFNCIIGPTGCHRLSKKKKNGCHRGIQLYFFFGFHLETSMNAHISGIKSEHFSLSKKRKEKESEHLRLSFYFFIFFSDTWEIY